MTINIYRNGAVQDTVAIDENSVFTHKLMGEHKIVVDTITESPLAIQIGDYIEHDGERFYMNTPTSVEKVNNFTYSYLIKFEGEIYTLFNKLFMDEGQADFSYHGTPNDLLLLLLQNINSIDAGWAIAVVENAPEQLLIFSGDTCRTALSKIAEAFGMEYRLAGKNIYLQKSVGVSTTLTFEYGRGKGLYSLTRNSIDDKSLVTRVFGFGGRKNIDHNYRYGASHLVFEERFLEANTLLYGEREASIPFEDIFPNRTGTVTAADGLDFLKVTDTALDFNINDHLIEGAVAKIVFKTGALAGYEFDIHRYLNGAKTIEFNPFTEENGYQLPNALNFAEVGDKYTLVDITMPQSYIDAAELELKTRTQAYLDENSVPRVTYALNLDDKYVRDNGVELKVGNLVRAIDVALGVDTDIRVSEVSYPLVSPSTISAVISDTIPYTVQERLIADTVDNKTVIVNIDRRRAELARQATARFRQLQDLIFDPDGYFDPENIKPQSIETLMLSVGAKSQNFGLLGVTIQPNYGGNPNSFAISGGQLAHYEIQIEGLGYIWNMAQQTFNSLVPASNYYVYARCSKTSLTGTWHISTTPKKTEDETGQYLFNLGVLYNVANGRRDSEFTKGMTFINGDTITTGNIKSLDGQSYFNLSEGKFRAGDNSSSLDWNVTTPNRLTIKGSIMQTSAGVPVNIPNYRYGYSPSASYLKGDTVTYDGVTYTKKTDGASVGIIPTNNTHWELFVDRGLDGQTLYTWVKYADDINGSGINDSPTGKEYIGFAYNKPTPVESNDRTLYQWSLLQGGPGVPGAPGADGQTLYTWIKYSNFSDGTNLYDVPNANTLYIGIAVNKTTPVESTSKSQYAWSKFKGDQGVPGPSGADGADGPSGPGIAMRGNFSSSKLYYNTPVRRDAVKYNDLWYLFKGTNATSAAWSLSNWEFVGAQFEMIATDLLLAENATIADWIIKDGKITSQSEEVILYGAHGKIHLQGQSVGGHDNISRLEKSGLLVTASGLKVKPPITGYDEFGNPVILPTGASAAITGKNSTSGGSLAPSYGVYGSTEKKTSNDWGGYFEKLKAIEGTLLTGGLTVEDGAYLNGRIVEKIQRASGTITVTNTSNHYHIICTAAANVYLPSSPEPGRKLIIKRASSGDVNIYGNGKTFYRHTAESSPALIPVIGMAYDLTYDGVYWQFYQKWS